MDTLQNAEAAEQAFDAIESSTQACSDLIASYWWRPGIEEYLAGKLRIPVRTLDLNALIDTEPLSDEIQHQCLFAIGAALRSEGKSL